MTTVTVLRQRSYDDKGAFYFGGSSDGSLNRVIDSLIAIRDSIPAEFRDVARCEFESEYESTSAEIEISYQRPATEAEINERAERRRREFDAAAARELALYAALKARYG